MSTNKDDKSFLIAPLFDGQRGPMFLAWSKKFLDAAEGKGNEDFSYADGWSMQRAAREAARCECRVESLG